MHGDVTWMAPPAGAVPSTAAEVHVWRLSLRPSPATLARLERHLSAEERQRAARFRFDEHHVAFVAGRGAQREILSRYTGQLPGAIAYLTSTHGKLSLAPSAAGDVRFNVSNAGGLALVAVTLGREIGVDLEALKPMPDAIDIAKRFFSAPENEVFASVPVSEREVAFFHCWTRKEAYIKAVGEGLSMPLDRFDVDFLPGRPARLLVTRGNPDEATRWKMRELHPGPGYVGAIAVEGDGWDLALYDFDRTGSA